MSRPLERLAADLRRLRLLVDERRSAPPTPTKAEDWYAVVRDYCDALAEAVAMLEVELLPRLAGYVRFGAEDWAVVEDALAAAGLDVRAQGWPPTRGGRP